MKKALGILLVLVLIATVFVSCSQDAGQKVAEELVSVSFDGSKARSLTPSRDPFAPANYVWTYTAQKADTTGLTTGETAVEKRINSGKGLEGTVPGFSQGYWNFTLYAYAAVPGSEEGTFEPTGSALYSGTASHVKVAKGDENVITVSVSPATTGDGYIAFDKAHLFLNAIKTGEDINAQGDERSANFVYGIYAINDTTFSTNLLHEVDGKTVLPAGSYFVRVSYRVAGDGDDRFDIADEAIVAVVYGGQTTTIKGSIGELSTDVSFGANEVEIPSAEGTEVAVPEDLSNYADTDAGYAAYQAAPVTEEHKPIVDVELSNATPTTEASVVATVPARAVYSLLQESIPDDPNTTSNMSLDLTVDVNTKETTASKKAYDINLIKTVETTTTTSTGTSTSTNASLVKNVAEYVAATIKVGTGLNDVVVYHSGEKMWKATNIETAGTANAEEGETEADDEARDYVGFYYYDEGDYGNGILYLKTKSFSPFVVTFTPDTVPTESKVLNATKGVGYADLKAAIDAASEGDTIRLLSDLDFSQEPYSEYKWAGDVYNPLVIAKNNITIDLNGKTIDKMGNNALVFGHILAADGRISNVTIKNGTLKAGKTSGVTNSYVLGIAGADSALIENVTTDGGINVYTLSRDVVIKNCSVYGTKYYAVCAQTGSEVTIEGDEGAFSKNTESTVATKAMFWVDKAGKDSDAATTENPEGNYGASSITIKAGTFTIDNGGVFYLSSGLKPVARGGIYNIDPSAYVADGYTAVAQGTTPETWVVVKADVQVQAGTETVAYMTLGQFRDDVNAGTSYAGKTVTLLDSVDLKNNEWTPIGTTEHPFSGIFDGQDHTISGLKVTENGARSGLFGVVSGTANPVYTSVEIVWDGNSFVDTAINKSNFTTAITNFTIENSTITTSGEAKYTGAIAGQVFNAYLSDLIVESSTISGFKAVGGIVGSANGSAIIDCNSNSTVEAYYNVGGIVGGINYDANDAYSAIVDCSNTGIINASGTGGGVGGIVGIAQENKSGVLVRCVNNGTINDTADMYVGGIAGLAFGFKLVYGCTNNGQITVSGTPADNIVNGIIASEAASFGVWNCVNNASIDVYAKYLAGICTNYNSQSGGIGYLYDCVNTGTLTNRNPNGQTMGLALNTSNAYFKDKTYANVAEINQEIAGVGNNVSVKFERCTVTNPVGELVLTSSIRGIESDSVICSTVDVHTGSQTSLSIDIPYVEITIADNYSGSLMINGSNNKVVVNEGVTVGRLIVSGNGSIVTNNGTITTFTMSGTGEVSATNNGTIDRVGFSSTGTFEFTNKGTVSHTTNENSEHTVCTITACKIVINNYGIIEAKKNTTSNVCSYAMLFYNGCDVVVNQYYGSEIRADVNGYTLACSSAKSVIYCTYNKEGEKTGEEKKK